MDSKVCNICGDKDFSGRQCRACMLLNSKYPELVQELREQDLPYWRKRFSKMYKSHSNERKELLERLKWANDSIRMLKDKLDRYTR